MMLSLVLKDLMVRFADLATPALDIPAFEIDQGSRLAITGASGSGKSTLVNMMTGLDRPTAGRIAWNGVDIAALGEAERDRWRAANVGLVMQDFHLFPGLSAIDNILLPARLAGAATATVKAYALELIAKTGLTRPDQPVETMSRGEMQRVAVSRAVVRRPGVIIADEPTASLDSDSASTVGQLLLDIAQSLNATLVIVTHDTGLAAHMQRHVRLTAGKITADANHAEIGA